MWRGGGEGRRGRMGGEGVVWMDEWLRGEGWTY